MRERRRVGDVVRIERHCPPAESTERCAGDCGGRTHAVRRNTDSLSPYCFGLGAPCARRRASAGVAARADPIA